MEIIITIIFFLILWKVMYEDVKSYNISILYLIPMGILMWMYLFYNTLSFFFVVFLLFLIFVLIMEGLHLYWIKYFNDWFLTKYGGVYDFVWLFWIMATTPKIVEVFSKMLRENSWIGGINTENILALSMILFITLIWISYWIWKLMKIYITKPTISNIIFKNKDNLKEIENKIYEWNYNWNLKSKPLNDNEQLVFNKQTEGTPLFGFIFIYFLLFEICKIVI